MSTSSSWINRLERLLDLREFPNLKTRVRLLRLFQALWLRPNSLNSALEASSGRQGRSLPSFVFHIIAVALHDLLSPVAYLFKLLIQRPYRAVRALFSRLTDYAVRAGSANNASRMQACWWCASSGCAGHWAFLPWPCFCSPHKLHCPWLGSGFSLWCAICLPCCSSVCRSVSPICA